MVEMGHVPIGLAPSSPIKSLKHQIAKSPGRQMHNATAVLLSGGLDSAVLLAEESAAGDVQPVYISVGLAWERAERAAIDHLLSNGGFPRALPPLVSLTVDMRDVYATSHWAASGTTRSSKRESPIPRSMRTSGMSRHKQPAALAVALFLAAASAAAQDGIDLDDLLDKVGEKIEQYFARAQRVVFLETTRIQY